MSEQKDHAVEIAVIKSELNGLREQQRVHARETKESIDKLGKDVRDLVAVMNRGKGAFGFAMVLAGGVGAGAVALLDALKGGIHP